jgi:hypothetical protein
MRRLSQALVLSLTVGVSAHSMSPLGSDGAPPRPRVVAETASPWNQLLARLQKSEVKAALKDRRPSAVGKGQRRKRS